MRRNSHVATPPAAAYSGCPETAVLQPRIPPSITVSKCASTSGPMALGAGGRRACCCSRLPRVRRQLRPATSLCGGVDARSWVGLDSWGVVERRQCALCSGGARRRSTLSGANVGSQPAAAAAASLDPFKSAGTPFPASLISGAAGPTAAAARHCSSSNDGGGDRRLHTCATQLTLGLCRRDTQVLLYCFRCAGLLVRCC